MARELIEAEYLIETPFEPAMVAEIMAGEQSSGTFVRVHGETDELRDRTRAVITQVEEIEPSSTPSLPNALLSRRKIGGPWRRARISIAYPVDNVGANLPTLAATVAGNLFDLGEVTGMRLERMRVPASYRALFPIPRQGIDGTRKLAGVSEGPLVGSIIKPNVGLSAEQTADLVSTLCEAGLDFIKDDEISANPATAPLQQRVPAVMERVRRHQDRTGKPMIIAFNITDETDAMRRHADLVAKEDGTCVMVSLNWCGYSAIQSLRAGTDLVLHGHRNGFGSMSRDPMLGIAFPAYQVLWRLAGVDHMHVHGLHGKFAQSDEEVVEAARCCLTPLTCALDDRVLPAFSSGQWAGTASATVASVGGSDFLFMAGGGVMAHPGGPAAGVASIRQAFEAAKTGQDLVVHARDAPELAAALDFFGTRAP